MEKNMSRFMWLVPIAVLIFLGLNISWTHAVFASLGNGMAPCPIELTASAKTRVAAFLGSVHSSPRITCQPQSSLGLKITHGTSRFAPLLPTLIVIGPLGTNTDVIAHEWMHAEISMRTSALLRTYRLPTWFDEGLAMQLDQRADYGESELRSYIRAGLLSGVTLNYLSTPGQFYRDDDRGKAHYALAKCTVARWLTANGSQSELQQLLKDVSWWREFPAQQFDVHAQACIRQAT